MSPRQLAISGALAGALLLLAFTSSVHAQQLGVLCGPDGAGYCTPYAPSGVSTSSVWGLQQFAGFYPDTSVSQSSYSECSGAGCLFFGSGYALPRNSAPNWTAAYTVGSGGAFSAIQYFVQFDASGEPYTPINWNAITPVVPFTLGTTTTAIAASSSLWNDISTSTITNCNSGNLIGDSLCAAGAYLFLPSPSVFAAYSLLPVTLSTHWPFSWLNEVDTTISTATSSTGQLPSYSLDLFTAASTTFASTTLPNFMPSFTFFSSSTVMTYLPSDDWSALQSLLAAALWLGFVADVFFTLRNRFHRV